MSAHHKYGRCISFLAALTIYCANVGTGFAQSNAFVGSWLSPVGELTFLVDGRAFGKQLSGGVVYTSFGVYAVNGATLSLHFDSVIPPRQCDLFGNCLPTMPMPSMTHQFVFENPDTFDYGVEGPGAVRFQRER